MTARVALLAVLAPAAVWSVSRDPVLVAGIRSMFATPPAGSAPDLAALEKAEPPIGFALPPTKPLRKVQALAGAKRRGCLLVVLGTCSSCYRFDASRWKRLADRYHLAFVGVGDFTEERAREYARSSPDAALMPLVADPRAEISGALKAVYGGRVYLFDPSWRLRWRTELGTEQMPNDRNPEVFERWMEGQP